MMVHSIDADTTNKKSIPFNTFGDMVQSYDFSNIALLFYWKYRIVIKKYGIALRPVRFDTSVNCTQDVATPTPNIVRFTEE